MWLKRIHKFLCFSKKNFGNSFFFVMNNLFFFLWRILFSMYTIFFFFLSSIYCDSNYISGYPFKNKKYILIIGVRSDFNLGGSSLLPNYHDNLSLCFKLSHLFIILKRTWCHNYTISFKYRWCISNLHRQDSQS